MDTMYSQILRRMRPEPKGLVGYGLVPPESMAAAVARVSSSVRTMLGIDVSVVSDFGGVRRFLDQACS